MSKHMQEEIKKLLEQVSEQELQTIYLFVLHLIGG